jgi:beta-glucosidase
VKGDLAEVQAVVTNTGSRYSGREVVQVYASAPKGSVEKPYQELVGYAKTQELQPGESQTVTITWALADMASYEEKNAAWVLDPGTYYIRVGSSSRDTHVAAGLVLEQRVVTEQLSNRLTPDCEISLLSSADAASYSYPQEQSEMEQCVKIRIDASAIACHTAAYRSCNEPIPAPACQDCITMDDVLAHRATLDELVGQLTVEEMAELCVGTARSGFGASVVIGSASSLCPGAAGDTTSSMIESRNIRNMVLADGPAGLRLTKSFKVDHDGNVIDDQGAFPGMEYIVPDAAKPAIPEDAVTYYQYCTAIPIATLLAQTWDVDVIEEAGDIVGEEMEELGVTLWLAPGMNIHRNPLCGRNFEYYSEDPLVAGRCAAADTIGVQKHRGIGTTIKHFAFNNQEDNRMHTNAHVTERAAREIYLKGFEIAVRTAQPMSIMTSYNLINGTHAANNQDLLTAIARDEWGFAGLVMTDWGTTGGIEMDPGMTFKYGCSTASGCVRAGNDLTMPGSQADVDDITAAVGNTITLGDLQACAKRILNILLQSSSYEGAKPYLLNPPNDLP